MDTISSVKSETVSSVSQWVPLEVLNELNESQKKTNSMCFLSPLSPRFHRFSIDTETSVAKVSLWKYSCFEGT